LSCEYNYDLYDAATVNRLIAQLRHLFEQIAVDPHRKLSQFQFPNNIGDPLPPFVPHSRLATAPNKFVAGPAPANSSIATNKKIFSRVSAHLGKIYNSL
jgi:hypothetical protein